MDKLLTIKDVAEYLKMSKEKVYKLAQQGKIPVSRIENQWRFRLEKVDAWIEANEMGSIAVATLGGTTLQIPSRAEPFLKWAGGKGQLLRQYEAFFPKKFNNFLEPFVGGGAVFFHLFSSGRLQGKKRIFLIDSNEELINCYLVIKEDVEKLIRILNSPKFINTEETFYKIRAEEPKDKFERAARTIYLNKTCFNGLYRVNSKGKFNVPFGGYKNPLICNSRNLIAVSSALQNVEILCNDFDKCLKLAKKEDFIYFDPPYQPLNKTSSFTSYTKEPFDEKEQVKLSKVFRVLDKIGCRIMLSNSDTSFIRKLYKNFRIEVVFAKRAINCKRSGRGEIKELVVLNY
jgi:DNA adenine methylase